MMQHQDNPATLWRKAVVEFSRTDGAKTIERVLFINGTTKTIVLIDVRNPTARHYEMRQDDYIAAFRGGSAQQVRDPYAHLHKPDLFFSEATRRERDRRLTALEPYLKAKPADRFDDKKRKGLMRQIWGKTLPGTHIGKAEAYDLVRQYLQRGQTKNALLSDRGNAGYTRQRRVERPPRNRDGRSYKARGKARSGIPIPAHRRLEICAEVIRIRNTPDAKTGRKLPWCEVHTQICQKFFPSHAELVLGKLAILPLPASLCPTQKQLKLLYYSQANPEEALRSREGEHTFNLVHRALKGDQRDLAYGPMKVVQIDFTVADIYLIDHTRARVVSRPTIVIITDTFSRLIIGFAVAWRRESWAVASLAILNMVADKAEFCANLGVSLPGKEWPSAMFEIALSDNGAMISYLKDHFQHGLELQFEHTASGRGDHKPVVESAFSRINEELIYSLEGCLPRTRDTWQMKRIMKRARSNAMYTLHEFTALVAEYCIYRNNFRVIADYPISDDMAGQVAPIPIRLWEYGIKHRSGLPRHVPVDQVRLACLCRAEATIRFDGLYFTGKSYTCERAEREGWFVRARSHWWKIPILYHPCNLSIIYLDRATHSGEEGDGLLEPCVRTKVEGDLPAISMYEHEWLQVSRADTILDSLEHSALHRSRYMTALVAHRDKALAAKRDTTTIVPANSTADMRILRQQTVAESDARVHDDLLSKQSDIESCVPPETTLQLLESMDRKFRQSVMTGKEGR
jgi:putative transposase